MTNVNIYDVLDGHVSLSLDCVDRLYLNAYVPNLQAGGQVVTFLTEYLGFPIPSPAYPALRDEAWGGVQPVTRP